MAKWENSSLARLRVTVERMEAEAAKIPAWKLGTIVFAPIDEPSPPIEEPGMNFVEAMKLVGRRIRVRRKSWDGEDHVGKDDSGFFRRAGFKEPFVTWDMEFDHEDFLATDWVRVSPARRPSQTKPRKGKTGKSKRSAS